MMDQNFWKNIASCWISIWSKEDEEKTKDFIRSIFEDAMSNREEEKSLVEELMSASTEDLEWLFN